MNHAPFDALRKKDGTLPEQWSALFFTGLALLFWRPDFSFFWRDDWNFLDDMRHVAPAYFLADHFGHVKPLFKLGYWLQLQVFGTHTIFFAYVNIILHGLCCYVVFRTARSIASTASAWVIAIALCVHPLVFNHLTWVFQQCITQHLLYQVAAVAFFLRWARKGQRTDLVLAALLTVVQNYFFGNGLFIPLLFAFGTWLFRRSRWDLRALSVFLLLFALFVAVQLALGGDRGKSGLSLAALPDIITYGVYFIGVNAARVFVLNEGAFGGAASWFFGTVLLVLCIAAVLRSKRDRRMAIFHIVWFIVTTCSIPMVRQASLAKVAMPHYYSVLAMIPMAFILEHALGGRSVRLRIPTWALRAAVAVLVTGVFLIDQQLKDTVSFRHFRNKQELITAMQEGHGYVGFDDPYFTPDDQDVEDPEGIYAYWKARDLLNINMGYAHDARMWTGNTVQPKEPVPTAPSPPAEAALPAATQP